MAKRDNHYEAAFEAWLRAKRLPYVAVDENKRSHALDGPIKNLDFIVSPPGRCGWLVDVKGRRFPSGEQMRYWRNWSTRDDLLGLARWERLFGHRFCGLLVFAYFVVGDKAPLPEEQLFEFRGGLYGFVAIRARHYAALARSISARWDTLAMRSAEFRRLAAPAEDFLLADATYQPTRIA